MVLVVECGRGFNAKYPHLYVHAEVQVPHAVCLGILITTNMIIASHKCLTMPDHKVNIYDPWSPTGGVSKMVKKEDIRISEDVHLDTVFSTPSKFYTLLEVTYI